jgi:hypothetical protein
MTASFIVSPEPSAEPGHERLESQPSREALWKIWMSEQLARMSHQLGREQPTRGQSTTSEQSSCSSGLTIPELNKNFRVKAYAGPTISRHCCFVLCTSYHSCGLRRLGLRLIESPSHARSGRHPNANPNALAWAHACSLTHTDANTCSNADAYSPTHLAEQR